MNWIKCIRIKVSLNLIRVDNGDNDVIGDVVLLVGK